MDEGITSQVTSKKLSYVTYKRRPTSTEIGGDSDRGIESVALLWRFVVYRAQNAHEHFNIDFLQRLYAHEGRNSFAVKYNIIGEIQEVGKSLKFIIFHLFESIEQCILFICIYIYLNILYV